MKTLRLVLLLSPIGVGDIVRTRRELHEAERERQEALEHEREQEGLRRVAAERVRIARELHDSLGHALVAINVRAGVARHIGDPDSASAALGDIQSASSEALGELRATLDLLRESGEAAPTRPSDDLDGVPELMATLRAGGVEARAQVDVRAAELPRPLGQAAYRIVQESFTNILRHADAATASLEVRVVARRLEIEVTDDGAPSAADGLSGARPSRDGGSAPRRSAATSRPVPSTRGWRVLARLALDPRGSRRRDLGPDRRGPIDGPGGLPCPDRGRARPDRGGRGGRRAPGGRARPCDEARRRAAGHPHAGDGRPGGGAADRGRAEPRPSQVLVLTTFELDEYVFGALRAGASGFLLKGGEPADLLAAIRVVAAGDALLAPSVTRRLIEAYAEQPPVERPEPAGLTELTTRELEVLGLVAEGLTNAEIAARLTLSPLTAKTHVSRILMKLGARDRVQLVVMAHQAGLVSANGGWRAGGV